MAPTFNTRVLGAGNGQSPHSLRGKPRLREGRRPSGVPQRMGLGSGPKAGPQVLRAGPQTEGRAERTHHSGWRGPFKAAGGRFAAGPWLGHHLGEGAGNAGGGGCSTGSAQPEPSASLRLLYKPARNNES